MFYEYSLPLFTQFPLAAEFERRLRVVPVLWDHYADRNHESPSISIRGAIEMFPVELCVSELVYETEVYRKRTGDTPDLRLVRARIPFTGDHSIWTLSPGDTTPSYILEQTEDVEDEILYGQIHERELILTELNEDVTRAKMLIQDRIEEVLAVLADQADQIENFNDQLPDLITEELKKAHKPHWPQFQ